MDLLFYILISVAVVGLIAIAAVLLFKRDRQADQNRKKGVLRRDRNLIIREATRRLSQDPRDVGALKDLACISFEEHNYADSYKYYRTLVSMCGANPEIDEFEANLRFGQSALKLKKMAEAHKHLMVARTLRENEFEVNLNLGIMEYARKDFAKAALYLAVARSQRPDDIPTNRYLGHSLYTQKQYGGAVEALQRVLDFEPEDKKTQFVLAKSYFALQNNDLALQIFSRLRTDPDIGAISALHSGTLNTNAKKYDSALEDFEIGLRHEKISPAVSLELKYRMAEVLLKKNELPKAIKLWKEINALQADYRDVAEKIVQYQEINTNKHLQTFLLSPSSEFITLCRRIVTRYFPNSKTKLVNISLSKGNYADLLALVRTPKWEEMVLFRCIRSQTSVGEFLLRDLYASIKEVKAGRSVCIAAGTFSEQAQSFVEARMIDLVDKENLIRILKKL